MLRVTEAPVKVEEASGPSGPGLAEEARRGFALPRLAWWIVEAYPRLLGATLLFTAATKALDESGVARVLEFDRVPGRVVPALVSLVIIVETTLGLLLILRPKLKWVLDAAMVLLAVYTVQLAYLFASRDAPACACLGQWQAYHAARFENAMGVGRNVCLMLALVWVRTRAPRAA